MTRAAPWLAGLLLSAGATAGIHDGGGLDVPPVLSSLVRAAGADSAPNAEHEALMHLSLPKALELAASHHPAVRSAQALRDATQHDLDQAQQQRYPTPALEYRHAGSGRSRHQSSLSLTQTLYAFGGIEAAIASAEHRSRAATIHIDEAGLELRDRVLVAYFDVHRTRTLIDEQARFVRQHEALKETVQRRFEGDVGSQSDLVLAQTRLDQALQQLLVLQAQHRKALGTLQTLTGTRVETVEPPAPVSLPAHDESSFKQDAARQSPTLAKLMAEHAALEEDARVASAASKPQWLLRAERLSGSLQDSGTDVRLVTLLQFQPGAGLSAFSRTAAAQSRALAARLSIDAELLRLNEQCATLYNDLQIALEQEQSLKKVLASNQAFFDSMLRQFQAGRRSWLDVLNSLRETNQAALALLTNHSQTQLGMQRVANLAGWTPLAHQTPGRIEPKD